MVTANELLDYANGSEEGRDSLTRALYGLRQAPDSEKQELVRELLGITASNSEPILRRSLAASLLGFNAHALGIAGSATVAKLFESTVETEFLQRGQLNRLTGVRLLFLRNLLAAALIADRRIGQRATESVRCKVPPADSHSWLDSLLETFNPTES